MRALSEKWLRRLRAVHTALRYEIVYAWPGWPQRTFNVGLHPARQEIANDPSYRDEAAQVELYASVADLIDQVRADQPIVSLLEIGCGRGGGLEYLAHRFDADAVGTERSIIARWQASSAGLRIACGSSRLPFPDESQDVVVSVETLFLFDATDDLLREVQRVLRPGGCLAVAVFLTGALDPIAARLGEAAVRANLVLASLVDETSRAVDSIVAVEPRRRAHLVVPA